jgi:hypothetical protein
MTISNFNGVKNQFIINDCTIKIHDDKNSINGIYTGVMFQSYNSNIAFKFNTGLKDYIALDSHYWDYSKTTGKHRNIFLNENKAETEKKIKSGKYLLIDLN